MKVTIDIDEVKEMEISEIACRAIKKMYDAGYTINELVRIYHYPGELIRVILTRK